MSIDGRKRKNPRVETQVYIDAIDEVGSGTTADPEGTSSMVPKPRKKESLPSRMQAGAEHLTAVKTWRVEIYIPN